MLYGERLFLTRDQAIISIRAKRPEGDLFGIPKLLLLHFEDIRWVDYLTRKHLWDVTFRDDVSAMLFRLTYV